MSSVATLNPGRLAEARALLARACAFDHHVALVADEKLVGPAPEPSRALAVMTPSGRLAGVAVVSGKWLRLLAVDPGERRRGVGGALLAEAMTVARAAGATHLRTGDQPGNYLAPGVDVRDEHTRHFLETRGFRAVGRNENLEVPLGKNPLVTRAHAAALAAAAGARGYEVRRARGADDGALRELAGGLSRAWAFEAARALENEPPTVHVALAGARLVAFACIDGNNRGLGWFGPAGTLPEHRGRGLGEALLLACLLDAGDAGHDHATIAWVGPRAFYARACGARPGRTFVVLEKELSP
jgi:mycothiol synthase